MLRQLTGLVLLSRLAEACSCLGWLPICTWFEAIPVVFIGEAISSNFDPAGPPGQLTLEHFRIVEAFKGVSKDATEIWVDPQSAGPCSGGHTVGKQYLIVGSAVVPPEQLRRWVANGRTSQQRLPSEFDINRSQVITVG